MQSTAEDRARVVARRILREHWVQAPGHIDLEVLAWRSGLTISTGGLDAADGRLVASSAGDGRGFIRIRDGIASMGRRRFIIAHELGHFHLHKRQTYTDTARELSTYQPGDHETEANLFASELLMPDFLFREAIRGREPSHAMLQSIADTFATSHLATAIQFITYTPEPCALLFVREGRIVWMRSSESWSPTGGGLDGGGGRIADSRKSGASPGPGRGTHIREDVLPWPEQQVVINLLWAGAAT